MQEGRNSKWEVLTQGRQLQIDLLIGRLDLGLLKGQILQLLVETFQEGLSWPSDECHLQYNNSSKANYHQLPQYRRHKVANYQQEPEGCQEGHQEGNCP